MPTETEKVFHGKLKHLTKKLDGKAEAFLVATACSGPPRGREGWTMQLLADRLVELNWVAQISNETVRQTLKKTDSSLG